MRVPICLRLDDPAPVISVYHEHAKSPITKDGRPNIETFSNDFLFQFCDIAEKWGIKGKFSIVPMPGNKGDIVNGLEGVSKEALNEWIETVKERLIPAFSVTPEMLTHHKVPDLESGEIIHEKESVWSQTQDRSRLVPYISKALSLLKDAGFRTVGVTSPWNFGAENLEEYRHSVSKAIANVCGSCNGWYFLGTGLERPYVALEEEGRTLVALPTSTRDNIWQTMDTTDMSEEYISSVADNYLTADGSEGEIISVLQKGGYPVILTHWQSLISNGIGTGMKVLDEVCRRIDEHLSDKVQWMSADEIAELVLKNKNEYPKPEL